MSAGFELLVGLRPGDYVERAPAPPVNHRALWPGEVPKRRTAVCERCAESYKPKGKLQRFCSRVCSGTAQRGMARAYAPRPARVCTGAGRAGEVVAEIRAWRGAR